MKNEKMLVIIVVVIIVVVSLLVASKEATAFDKWDKTDYLLLGTSVTFIAIDWGQTRYIASNPGLFHETNSLLGNHPSRGRVNRYFVGSIIGTTVVAMVLPEKYRKLWLGGVTFLELSATAHNRSIGIGMKF